MNTTTHLAVDFGGGSGRVIAGTLDAEGRLTIKEIHRFANGPVERFDHLYWDFRRLADEMLEGLRKAAAACTNVVSIAVDTWGVDFGFLDHLGALPELVYCYRDPAWDAMLPLADAAVGNERLYAVSGLQPLAINSIYHLMWMRQARHDFPAGYRLLFMPDLFNYLLTGVAANEYTIASTSGLLNAQTRSWEFPLLRELDLPHHTLCPIVMPGASLGPITADVAERTGLPETVQVIAAPSHDTASAVAAVGLDDDTAFLSSGTWSLLGIRLGEPITSEAARRSGYANEGGADGILFLQNITGLWILQQLADSWRAEGLDADYPTLIALAEAFEAAEAAEAVGGTPRAPKLIDVDDPAFARPTRMEQAIADHLTARSHAAPQSRGETVLIVLRSLAARYARGIEELTAVTGRRLRRLHIIGGGSRNALLNRLTAEATGLELTAGPAEATAIGNILTQVKATVNTHPTEIIQL